MGTLINFISQHIAQSPSTRDRDEYFVRSPTAQKQQRFPEQTYHQPQQQQQQQQPSDRPRSYFISSKLSALEEQRERALQQFPCEEKHSFNPHYQHNLSTSPSFSTPPSLSSSPTNSSPSSAYSSSSSTSSLSRATGARPFSQDSYPHHQQSYNTISGGTSTKHEYSYHRHQNRRQNLRCYTYQQQQQESYVDEWMFGIAEDEGVYRGSSARMTESIGASMARTSPQESPISPSSSSSTVSLKSSLSRKSRPQRANIMNTFLATPRSTVTFSPVVLEHPVRNEQPSTSSSSMGLLPSISESSLSSLASDSSNAVATASSDKPASSSSSSQQQGSGAGRLTAKQSLMRIAHCAKSEDGWCSQKAGQYAQRYAEAKPRGMMVDGRRSRRM